MRNRVRQTDHGRPHDPSGNGDESATTTASKRFSHKEIAEVMNTSVGPVAAVAPTTLFAETNWQDDDGRFSAPMGVSL